jgi:hypothetical protein
VPDEIVSRERWLEDLKAEAVKADWAFFDPDNGVEVPSLPVGRRGSSKYVFQREILEAWGMGLSVLIYQHFPRVDRGEFIGKKIRELKDFTGSSYASVFRTAEVAYFLLAQEDHRRAFKGNLPSSKTGWKEKDWLEGYGF